MNDSITITGNVASDPDRKRTPSGVTITTFRLASSQRRFDRASNAWVDAATNWYTVSAFRGLADHAFHSLRKGDRVLLTGRLRVRDWDNGTKRGTAVDIEAEAIGHDLLWGTSTFVKDAPSAPADAGSAWAPTEADSQDSWTPAAPEVGADDAGPDAPTSPRADAPQLELAGVEPPF